MSDLQILPCPTCHGEGRKTDGRTDGNWTDGIDALTGDTE